VRDFSDRGREPVEVASCDELGAARGALLALALCVPFWIAVLWAVWNGV
jgi:hypothetical protein